MSNSNLISALNAISQMVQPLGHKVSSAACVEVTYPDTLNQLADKLGVEHTFNAVFYKVKDDSTAVDKVLEFYQQWAESKREELNLDEE